MVISLAAGTVLDADPGVAIDAAAGAGFDAVGVRFAAPPGDAALARLGEQVRSAGLQVLDVEVARLREPVEPAEFGWLIDAAGALGARFVLAVSDDPDPARTARALQQLADHAEPLGVSIALEFMAFTAVRTLAAAAQLVTAAGRDNLAVLVDVLHLARSGGSVDDVRGRLGERIGYLQLCDAPRIGPSGPDGLADEARHRRLLPGEGELPVLETLSVLRERLELLPLSVEVQSDQLARTHTPGERARAAMRATRAVLDRVIASTPESA